MTETKKLEHCFICKTPVHEIEENRFGCDKCKRIWYYKDGDWLTEARTVVFKKNPEVGDSYDDIITEIRPND